MRTVALIFLLICCGRSKQDEDSEREEIGPDPSPYLDSCAGNDRSRPKNFDCPDLVIELKENLSELSPEDPEDVTTQLARTGPELNFFSNLYDGISSGISTVYRSADSAKTRLYSKISDVTSDFAEKVRTILREEFWDLIVNGLGDVFHTATAPGNGSFVLARHCAGKYH